MLISRVRLFLLAKLLVLVAMIVFAGFAVFGDRGASARPCHEVEHWYYADETYGEIVGYKWFYCQGTYTWGQVTQWDSIIDGECCGGSCPECQ